MPKVEPGLTVKSLAEVAWLVSRVGRQMIESQSEPSPQALRDFWQNTRQLQRSWDRVLNDAEGAKQPGQLEELAAQLFTSELLARVWATVLAGIDQRTGRNDLTRIANNAVSGLMQIRNRLLSQVLLRSGAYESCTADLDRLRRRCDRWTDLLIGNLSGREELFQFAFDVDRARDFAAEATESDLNAPPVELLIAAGLRLSFLGQLPDAALDSPAFAGMLQSILGSIPEQAFQNDGSLPVDMTARQLAVAPLPTGSSDDVLMPGISLAHLRRRFS